METFTQIIFPPKERPPVVILDTVQSMQQGNNNSSYVPEQIYCAEAGGMILLINCVRCRHPSVLLEQIMLTGVGC